MAQRCHWCAEHLPEGPDPQPAPEPQPTPELGSGAFWAPTHDSLDEDTRCNTSADLRCILLCDGLCDDTQENVDALRY